MKKRDTLDEKIVSRKSNEGMKFGHSGGKSEI